MSSWSNQVARVAIIQLLFLKGPTVLTPVSVATTTTTIVTTSSPEGDIYTDARRGEAKRVGTSPSCKDFD